MNTVPFLAEWAVRSSILILSGALLLRLLRVKDPSIRLAAWTAILCGSLAFPALTVALPKMPLTVTRVVTPALEAPGAVYEAAPVLRVFRQDPPVSNRFDWARAAVAVYTLIAGTLLLRLCAGFLMTRSLRRTSRATRLVTEGIEIRESDRVAAPVVLGIARFAIVLPADWRDWDGAKLDAVLAHERSHIRRNDPVVQLLSAIHRALLWHSPLSWFLHRRIVRLAEEASDDAAVAAARDRASYAEVLLEFMQRGVRGANWQGVAMARYGQPEDRIHRILDGSVLSAGVPRWSVAAILVLGLPLAYVTAAVHPQRGPQTRTAMVAAQVAEVATASNVRAEPGTRMMAAAQAATAPGEAVSANTQRDSAVIRRYMIFLDDSRSGSWDSRDPVDEEALRARFGRRFAWFRQAGNEYVVTDAGVLAEMEKAMEPQNKVNRMQSEVNVRRSAVNEMQSKVNSQQNKVNALQQREVNSQQNDVNALQREVNRRQDLLNRIQAAATAGDKEALIRKMEAAIRELRPVTADGDQETVNRRQAQVNAAQARVNEEQQKVNEAQARVNEEQQKVNEQQHKVNEEQGRVSSQYSARIREIFDAVLRRGLAQRLN